MKGEVAVVSAVWLRRIGDKAQILAEVGGVWRILVEEYLDSNFSHIVEARAIEFAKPDPLMTEER